MSKSEIEARLERSLRNQVRVPRLDGRFDAAVWARIDREKARVAAAPLPASTAASRLMFASNVVGVLVAISLVIFFGAQAFSGVELRAALPHVALPAISPGLVERVVAYMTWPVTFIALGSGLMFTSLGRKLRAEYF